MTRPESSPLVPSESSRVSESSPPYRGDSLSRGTGVESSPLAATAPTSSAADVLVPLVNGPTVPLSVVLWLTRAEDRGLHLRLQPDGRVHVGPRALVEPADSAFIQRHRDTVLACVVYIDRLCEEPL